MCGVRWKTLFFGLVIWVVVGDGGKGGYLGCDDEGAEVDGTGFEDLGYGSWDGHCCGGGGGEHLCMRLFERVCIRIWCMCGLAVCAMDCR